MKNVVFINVNLIELSRLKMIKEIDRKRFIYTKEINKNFMYKFYTKMSYGTFQSTTIFQSHFSLDINFFLSSDGFPPPSFFP